MKYLFLLYDDSSKGPAAGSPEAMKVFEGYGAFFEETNSKGAFQSGDPVQDRSTAKTVRVRGGKTDATSGAFHNGAEQLIGFYVLDCATEDAAVDYATRIPASASGAVEVRPIRVM